MLPLLAVALVSAGALAFEVLLTRLFSIVQWHHFAYMVISIALLGYGASGAFLAVTGNRLRRHVGAAFAAGAILFAVSTVASFAVAERLPFNALAVIWEPRQLLYLLVLYLLFALPFFCAATCIGLALVAFPERIGRTYRYDLVGASLGAIGLMLALIVLFPDVALKVVALSGFLAAALAISVRETGVVRKGRAVGYATAAIAACAALPPSWTALQLSEYKGLSQTLLVPGVKVLAEEAGLYGLLTVVSSSTIPFRYAPGLSLSNSMQPPAQLGVFTDGDGLTVITAFDGRLEPLAYLDQTPAALPYHLLEKPEVLILGVGGGADVLLALLHRAPRIDAVELNSQLVRLVSKRFAEFAGRLYEQQGVRIHVAEARSFVAGSRDRYDLIQLPLLDSFATAAAGTHSLSESYIYTIEAFEQYLDHLRPGGYLAITRWLKLPPRDSLRLFATAGSALERRGIGEPGRHLALVRSWNTTTLLVKNGPLTGEDAAAIRRFAEERAFDLGFLPGMSRDEENRFNVLDQHYFFDSAAALLGPQRKEFLQHYKFDVAPTTDDRPYFFDFFKWQALPELLERRTLGGAALLDWGYAVLVATLVQALVLALVLILTPLLWLGRQGPQAAAAALARWRIALYFLAIGFAFLFIEIASIQRFVLFLGHPVYAIPVVLCAFLFFAGIGGGFAPRLTARLDALQGLSAPRALVRFTGVDGRCRLVVRIQHPALALAVAGIVAATVLHLVAAPSLFRWLMPLPDTLKIAISLVLIAPLAFFMGLPFPLALVRVAAARPGLVPWAWGINGCASVLSAILAILLAMSLGFSAVLLIAIGLYLVAAATLR
jgi:spermidine synthase